MLLNLPADREHTIEAIALKMGVPVRTARTVVAWLNLQPARTLTTSFYSAAQAQRIADAVEREPELMEASE